MGYTGGSQDDFYRKNGYVKVGNRWVYQGKKPKKETKQASTPTTAPAPVQPTYTSPDYSSLLSPVSSNEALLAQYYGGQAGQSAEQARVAAQQAAAAQAQAAAEAQARAAAAAQQQERLRAQAEAEALRQRQQGEFNSFLGGYNLANVDADKYAGESSQAASYRQFLDSQLGTAGFNAGSLLSGYDPTQAISQANLITENFDAYKSSLNPHVQKYGGYDSVKAQALGVQAQGSQQLSLYDQQVRDQLSQLGQAYTAYSQLGDINQFQGTGQERVSQLLGINRPDVESLNQAFTGMGNEYGRIAKETQMLYGGDLAPSNQYNQQMQAWADIANKYNPAAQGLLSTYGSAASTLYGMYGNLQDVMSGRIRSEAERQQGLISSGLNTVSSVLGEASQAGTRLQDLYNQTASTLRTQRIAEGQQLREQKAQADFTQAQNRQLGLAATTLQRPSERTRQSVIRRPDEDTYQSDPLGLTRGYSSLLGG